VKQTFGPYHNKSLSDFLPVNESHELADKIVRSYMVRLDEARRHGRGLTIVGPNGVGKTLLASIVLNDAGQRGYRIEAIELAEYVGLHKDVFTLAQLLRKSDDDTLVDQYVKVRQHVRYIHGVSKHAADWVLFDDVGREFPSESGWSQNEFFDTLRCRWNRGLPSLLTTNLPLADLEGRYTEGLTSLLMEATDVIVMEGDDYRCRRVS
jgi:DNA replication protein DnaC